MSRASQRELMIAEANECMCSDLPLEVRILELLNIGFRHGAVWKADEIQPILSRLEGIEVDLELVATFQSGSN